MFYEMLLFFSLKTLPNIYIYIYKYIYTYIYIYLKIYIFDFFMLRHSGVVSRRSGSKVLGIKIDSKLHF